MSHEDLYSIRYRESPVYSVLLHSVSLSTFPVFSVVYYMYSSSLLSTAYCLLHTVHCNPYIH